jgi:hypothetical protein
MKYAVEMGSGAMIYIPSFIKIGSGIHNLIGGIYRQTYADRISLISLKENRLITNSNKKIREELSPTFLDMTWTGK